VVPFQVSPNTAFRKSCASAANASWTLFYLKACFKEAKDSLIHMNKLVTNSGTLGDSSSTVETPMSVPDTQACVLECSSLRVRCSIGAIGPYSYQKGSLTHGMLTPL